MNNDYILFRFIQLDSYTKEEYFLYNLYDSINKDAFFFHSLGILFNSLLKPIKACGH